MSVISKGENNFVDKSEDREEYLSDLMNELP
jgi:hypothetical protein